MKNLFNLMVIETAKLAKLSVKSIPISSGSKKRWADLATFWATRPGIFSDTFYTALFHIARGTYPRIDPCYKPLITLVEKAILEDSDALSVWRHLQTFDTAFFQVTHAINETNTSRRWKSYAMRRFVYCRLYVITLFRNEIGKPIDLATMTHRQISRAKTIAEIAHDYFTFRTIIQMLIPDSTNWEEQQWLSERNIFACLKARCGKNYEHAAGDFDRLFALIKQKLDKKPYYKTLFCIDALPDVIVEAIWGDQFKDDLCRQLLHAAQNLPSTTYRGNFVPQDPVLPQNIVKSWAYQTIYGWYDSKQHVLSHAVKSALLSFYMGIHPATAKSSGA